MSRQERLELISQLENKLNSPIICYINGDRENVSTRIAPDVIRVFYEHLERLGDNFHNLNLLLYTRGGDVLTAWRLVNLLREYCDNLTILVPFRCYSAGTLISLGANNLIMNKMGELGPIDPSVSNAFNPQDPLNTSAKIPISVEDVSAYIALAKEMGEIKESNEMIKVFELLTENVHPLALGNVYRNYSLIRSLAYRLLSLHIGKDEEKRKQEIIDNLTEKLYAHNHLISRKEAYFDIGLPVNYADKEEEYLLWNLYLKFEEDLELHHPFVPAEFLNDGQQETNFQVSGGLIESSHRLDSFIFNGIINQTNQQDVPGGVNVNIQNQGWKNIFS